MGALSGAVSFRAARGNRTPQIRLAAELGTPWKDVRMTGSDPKADLRRYLQEGREALLWKLDGLSEYDIRRPLVLTGTKSARADQASGRR
jgi:predicted RecB family nuclease